MKYLFLTTFLLFMPCVLWACPLCADASPFKVGLLLAVGFLMLVPFGVTYLMYGWIRKASPVEE